MEQPGTTAPEMWRRPGIGPKGSIERGARAGVRTLRPGGPGGPSAPTTRGCLQWLDEEETKGGESLPGRQRVKSPASRSPPGSMGPGTQIAANWSAGWRARRKTRPAARRTLTKDAPFGAPAPHFFRRGARKRGPARGRHKNTGDDACPDATGSACRSIRCTAGSTHSQQSMQE